MKPKLQIVDLAAAALMALLVITGLMLHADVHHRHVYDNTLLWGLHEGAGIALMALLVVHLVQHGALFRAFGRVRAGLKVELSALAAVASALMITGLMLFAGSHSPAVSAIHYYCSIAFMALAAWHFARRLPR